VQLLNKFDPARLTKSLARMKRLLGSLSLARHAFICLWYALVTLWNARDSWRRSLLQGQRQKNKGW